MEYGQRLLPAVLDARAAAEPDRVLYAFPVTDDPAGAFAHVTTRTFANAVNRTAWLLEAHFGPPGAGRFPAIGYIGPNDLRYGLLVLAANKAGYAMMLLSPRNSLEGHLAVLDACACARWALPAQRLGRAEQVLSQRRLDVLALPEQAALLDPTAVAPYPFDTGFAAARQHPFVILHTSGSTGLPKPVRVPHGSVATTDAQHVLAAVDGRRTHAQMFDGSAHVAYSTLPHFHSAGVVFCFALPLYYDLRIVLGPPMQPVSTALVQDMIAADVGGGLAIDGALLAPSILEQMAKDPDALAALDRLAFAVYGGGPLNRACGDRIQAATRCALLNLMGVTEGSLFPVVRVRRDDWAYHQFHPAGGFRFVERAPGLFEQVQTRDARLDRFQAFLQTFPAEHEVRTKDLYSQHPSRPDVWLYRGRTDDVLVLSNGEKVNPVDMEAGLTSHPAVKAALVVGQARFQVAAVLELMAPLPDGGAAEESLRESLRPYIARANRDAPAHGQLHPGHVLLAPADMPFLRAGKDTVLRAATTQLFAPLVDALYTGLERQQAAPADADAIDLASRETIVASLRRVLVNVLDSDAAIALDDTADLFAAGLDSLSVLRLAAGLQASVKAAAGGSSPPAVTARFVYAHPTLAALADALDALVRPPAGGAVAVDSVQRMQALIDELTSSFEPPSEQDPGKDPGKDSGEDSGRGLPASAATVLLTGSTGSLGMYLLDALLARPSVRRVVCLNRAADARARHEAAAPAKGLCQSLAAPRVVFHQADLARPQLGLAAANYAALAADVTHILHNQWPVDFHRQLPSFVPHVRGVRRLVDLALQSARRARLLFVSSVGVVQASTQLRHVPERLLGDLSAAEGGYGQSKLVAEHVLATSSQHGLAGSTIVRLGQIAGPVAVPPPAPAAAWKRQEWLPSIVASSRHLRRLPASLASLDRIDWVPVNRAADILVELLFAGSSTEQEQGNTATAVYHLVNPTAAAWADLLPTIQACLAQSGTAAEVVAWDAWLAALGASAEEAERQGQGGAGAEPDYDANPGLKLLDFYRAATAAPPLPVLGTEATLKHSPTLRSLGAVTPAWMGTWMAQWGFA